MALSIFKVGTVVSNNGNGDIAIVIGNHCKDADNSNRGACKIRYESGYETYCWDDGLTEINSKDVVRRYPSSI